MNYSQVRNPGFSSLRDKERGDRLLSRRTPRLPTLVGTDSLFKYPLMIACRLSRSNREQEQFKKHNYRTRTSRTATLDWCPSESIV